VALKDLRSGVQSTVLRPEAAGIVKSRLNG